MSDTSLRQLERRWNETGTVADEAAYLLERVRNGDLTRERLELAAYLGDEAAQAANGGGLRLLAMSADWFRGLTRWSPALAAWALAEACAAHQRPEDGQLLEQVRSGLRTAYLSGEAAADVARSLPRVPALCRRTGVVKWLCLWWECLREDGRRGRLDDPEIVRVLDDVRSRFESHEVGQLSYAWSERRDGSWVHWVYHLRRSGVEKGTVEDASAGWQPDAAAGAPDPSFLYDRNFAYLEPERARAAVRTAVLPWALASRGSST